MLNHENPGGDAGEWFPTIHLSKTFYQSPVCLEAGLFFRGMLRSLARAFLISETLQRIPPIPMDSTPPESDPNAPQPLDYANPRNQPARQYPRFKFFVKLALLLLLLAYLLLPTLNRPHPSTNREIPASNLREIGQAILLYTNGHQVAYPDSFRTILLNEDITSAVFVSPSRTETPANGPTTRAIADQLNGPGHLSYVYLGGGLSANTVTPNDVVAYEMIAQSGSETNVLFGDGHVEFVGPVTTARIISQAAKGTSPITLPAQSNSYP